MRVPQVSERIKEAPAQALRGVFAGIGQVLLIADRLRNKAPAGQPVPPASAPQPSGTRADPATSARPAPRAAAAPAAPPAERVTEARDFDKTGNVRLLTSEEAAAGETAPTTDAAPTVSEDVTVAEDVAVAEDATGGEAASTAGEEAGALLPNYDELSIASLRARLRNLDAAQVKQLAEYERAHAARADVITMFERRIAKLEAGD